MYDAVAAHKESGSIAAVAYGGAVDLFRADEGITLSANISWQGHASIRCLAFTPDGKFLLGAGGNLNCCPGEVMVHEVGKIGIRRWFYAHQGHATAIATGKDPDLFATGGADSMIRLWSLSDVLGPEAENVDVQK